MNKKYWLRGGILLSIIGTSYIFTIPLVTILFDSFSPPLVLIGNIIGGIYFSLGVWKIIEITGFLVYILGGFYYILIPIIYFIIGSILGSIYGKLRSNKVALISYVLIILIAVIGSTSLFTYRNREVTSVQDCETSTLYQTKDACYNAAAQETQDYSTCDLINNDENLKKQCTFGVAMRKLECEKSGDPDYCYLYTSQNIRLSARDNRCDTVLSQRGVDQCLNFRNGSIDIADLCKNIKDSKLNKECLTYDISGIQVRYLNK